MVVCCEGMENSAGAFAEVPAAEMETNGRGENERPGTPLESGEDAREGGDGIYAILCGA